MAAARKKAPGSSRPAEALSMVPTGPRPPPPTAVPLNPVPTPGLRVPVVGVAPPTVVVPAVPEALHGSISKAGGKILHQFPKEN